MFCTHVNIVHSLYLWFAEQLSADIITCHPAFCAQWLTKLYNEKKQTRFIGMLMVS